MRVIRRLPDRGYLDTWLWVPKPFVDVEGTKRALTYEVTDSYTGRAKWLYLWQETADHLLLPRAFWDPTTLPFPVVDCRPLKYTQVSFKDRIELDYLPKVVNGEVVLRSTGRDVQQRSFEALQSSQGGTLQLACGVGKTVIALKHIAASQVPALIMLDNTNLLAQWWEDVEQFLEVPGGIGSIVAGKKDWQKSIVLATYQSIANWADTMPEEVRRWFGVIVWDEGHHVSAPTYAKSAPLFYGQRISLTATPERDDGFHVISDMHIGPVLYKHLTPQLKPKLAFFWTGLEPDMRDPNVASKILDINGEVHTSKLNGFFGQWPERLNVIIAMTVTAQQAGRKTLVLSNSVDEVINLMALWTYPQGSMLYTDIPVPTNQEVGSTLTPAQLPDKELKKCEKALERLTKQIAKAPTSDHPYIQAELLLVNQALKQHEVHKKIQNELAKRQKKYVEDLVKASDNSRAGFLTYGVKPAKRQEFLDKKSVVFAVTKYGKEGMDCQALDTVILSSLFSSKNGLQQMMGRPTRPMPGKKEPLVVMLVDNVGQCIGMSKKLQTHLRSWPREEGGPYDFILVNYPASWTNQKKTESLTTLFGPSSTVDPPV